MYDGFSDIL